MSTATKKPNLVLKRLIAAPRERVFMAWIDPKQFAKWWGPYEFGTPVVELDIKVGGKINVHMQGPAGSPWEKPYPMGGEFREISKYDRLVFTSTLPDGKGGLMVENLNELTFADKGGKTARGKITHPGYEHLAMEVAVKAIEPETLFSFTWHPYAVDPKTDYSKEPPTMVEFRLDGSPSGSTLWITESGFDKIPEARRAEAFRMNEGGWTEQMKKIANHLAR